MLTREEVERIEATLKRNLEDFEVHGGMVRYWVSINDAKRLLREYQAVVDERDALAADWRMLMEALSLATVWCRYRSNDGYDTCEDNCTKAHRYQEQCPVYLPTVEPSLIAAEVERVKRLEAVAEAARAQDPPASANLARALAAYREGEK